LDSYICIICIEFQQSDDLNQMHNQIKMARIEELVPEEHLVELEQMFIELDRWATDFDISLQEKDIW